MCDIISRHHGGVVLAKKNLLKSGIVISSATLLSRILGLIRDVVIANLLGATMAADVFFFANRIPNFFRRLFAEGAFNQAFVPVLAEYNQKDQHSTREFIAMVTGTLGFIITIVTILGVLGSTFISMLFGWGWYIDAGKTAEGAEKFELAALVLKITFPYLWFITITAVFSAVLNTKGRFAVPALTPCLLNLSTIACALWLSPQLETPVIGLAWGIFIGGFIQLLFQLPFIINLRLLAKPRFAWNDPGVKKIRTLMIPALFGVSVNQINLLINTALASFLATGTISYLYYSDRILEFPLGMFAVAISTVILPVLSRGHVSEDSDKFHRTMDWAVRMVMILGIPAMIGIITLRESIISVIFMHGSFTATDAAMSSASLFASATGLLSLMLVRVLAPGFYARQDTKTPVKYGIYSMISNIIFNLALIYPLGYLGLALSTALSGTVNLIFLISGLHRRGIYRFDRETLIFGFRLLLAASVMGGVLICVTPDIDQLAAMTIWTRILWLVLMISGGALIYFLAGMILGIRKRDLRVNESFD